MAVTVVTPAIETAVHIAFFRVVVVRVIPHVIPVVALLPCVWPLSCAWVMPEGIQVVLCRPWQAIFLGAGLRSIIAYIIHLVVTLFAHPGIAASPAVLAALLPAIVLAGFMLGITQERMAPAMKRPPFVLSMVVVSAIVAVVHFSFVSHF